MSASPVAHPRIIGLDIIRISLMLLIYLFHSHMHYHCDYGLLNSFISMGAIAMTAFFMLSGYSLHIADGQKNLTDKTSLRQFYAKRFWGIMPLYYFCGSIYVIYLIATSKEKAIEELLLFPIEALGLQSYFSSLFEWSHNGGTWFISCLLICYFFYPFLEKTIGMLDRHSKICAVCALGGILLLAPIIQFKFHLASIYSNPFFRMCEFSIGILLAQINSLDNSDFKILKLLRNKCLALFVVTLLISAVTIALHLGIPGDYMLYNWIALPCFVVLFISGGGYTGSEPTGIAYLCKISYAFFLMQLYLWPITRKVFIVIGIPEINILKIIVSFSICLGGAIVLYEGIEKPIRRKHLQKK